MLTKDVDQVIIGKSTVSLLLGAQLLHTGSNVLLLDDDRVGYGEFYERFIGEVTVQALNAWGEALTLEPLINIYDYLSSTTQVLHVPLGQQVRRVRLGPSPMGNMLELARKLGHPSGHHDLNMHEDFEQDVINSFKRLGRDLYKFQSLSQLDAKVLTSHLPRELVIWSEPIVAPFLGRKQLDLARPWDAFFYLCRAIFHNKFSLDFSAAEVWHLLIEALSPRYELNADSLVKDLADVYQLRGGQFKSTRVREWMFYKSSPWSLELSSYEGIIHPRKLVVMGSHCSAIGLELSGTEHAYLSVLLDYKVCSRMHRQLAGEVHVIFSPKDVGTDFGLWFVRAIGTDQLEVTVAVRKREGMKIEFLSKQLEARTLQLLQDNFPLLKVHEKPEKIEQGLELWIDEHFHKPRRFKGELLLPANIRLRQVLSPGETERVKNVSYFGPAKRDRLGLVSSLLDMKDSLPRLQ